MRKSAGILLYRVTNNNLQILLVHPGGPFWKNKDLGAWSIPKGEFAEDEEPLTAAIREFLQETGTAISGNFKPLTPVKQKGGKVVYAWALEGNIDATTIQSNTFKMKWPPKSDQWQTFMEVDKGAWFSVEEAKIKINAAQAAFLEELLDVLERKD